VPLGGSPVLRAFVDRDGGVRVAAFVNEVDRLRDEEFVGIDIEPVPWHDPLPAPASGALVDTALAAEFRGLRAPLLPAERARFAALGGDLARAVTPVLHAVRPEATERTIAADLAGAIVATGAEPVVLLVGGESRAGHRHPLPTDAPAGRRVMV